MGEEDRATQNMLGLRVGLQPPAEAKRGGSLRGSCVYLIALVVAVEALSSLVELSLTVVGFFGHWLGLFWGSCSHPQVCILCLSLRYVVGRQCIPPPPPPPPRL